MRGCLKLCITCKSAGLVTCPFTLLGEQRLRQKFIEGLHRQLSVTQALKLARSVMSQPQPPEDAE